MKRPALVVPRHRTGRRVAVAAIAVVLLASLAAVAVPRLTALSADTAFRAAGTDVPRTELERRTELLGSLYGITSPRDPAGADRFRRESARAVATSVVLDRAAADRGIVIPDKVARDALTAMAEQQAGAGGGREAFVRLLSEAGASEDDVIEEIRRQKATEQLFGQVAGAAGNAVTDADVRAYYRDHPAELTTPEQRRLRNVVVATEGEAADVLRRLTAGEDPAVVAGQSSLDASSRGQGGDLGVVTRDRLDPTYGAAAFTAAPGGFFGPVRSASGWNVGQVLEVAPAVLPPFDRIRSALDAKLRDDRALGVWRGWMDQQTSRADIEYADDLRPTPPPGPGPAPAAPPAPVGAPAAPATAPQAAVTAAAAVPGPETAAPGQSFLTPLGTALLIAVAFFGIGWWGRQNVDELIPAHLSDAARAKRQRVMRRGTVICMVSAVGLAALAAVGFVSHLL